MMEELKLIRPGEVRVRIAPSPTGPAHIGLARTALFNYLFAQKHKGTFILRIEDTDEARSKKEYEQEIIQGLKWLGLEYQEGPDKGGEYGPYRQSERKKIYRKYIKKLLDEEKIYYCFCSPDELKAHKDYLLSIGEPPRYSGKCRNLSKEEVEENLRKGKPFVLRLKTPAKKVVFNDMLRGKIEYDTSAFGDIVIAKDLETPLYNLAVVIDDFEMGITHIIRGEDHIPNTPKQILIAEALGINKVPNYLHLPLILGENRAKLSKRDNSQSLLDYREQGYLPEAIINFLVLLGWNPGSKREIFSLNSLIKEFSIDRIQKSGAAFNIQKLEWLNASYIRSKPINELTELCLPYLEKAGLIEHSLEEKTIKTKDTGEEISFDKLQAIISLYQKRLKKLSEIPGLVDFFFKEKLEYPSELLIWKDMDKKEVKNNLDKVKKTLDKIKEEDWFQENIENTLLELAEEVGEGDKGKTLWPLRVALSGKKASAGPFEIAQVIGKEKTIKRIKDAQQIL